MLIFYFLCKFKKKNYFFKNYKLKKMSKDFYNKYKNLFEADTFASKSPTVTMLINKKQI